MNKDIIKNIALILLFGITTYSMVRYVGELKVRLKIQESLTQTQSQVAALIEEKQSLVQELEKEKELCATLVGKNEKLKAYSKASKIRMARLFKENYKIQNEIENINTRFAILKAENQALINSHKRSYVENEQLKSKLSSVVELKKVIRELKRKKPSSPSLKTETNQGFLIKNGRSTLEKIKIEVIPTSYTFKQKDTGNVKIKEL